MTNTGIRLLRPVETAMVLLTPPAGATEREFLADLLANADESYAKRGWDQPYQLLAVAPLISLPKKSRDCLSERARAEGIPFEAATAVIVAEVPVQRDGALIDLIGGCRVPEWVKTLVLTSESWVAPASSGEETDPTASLRPSAHPGRVEARTTIAVAADGYTLHLMTVRDGDGQLSVGDAAAHPCGRTTDLLLRLMGAPTAPSAYYPGHLVTAVMLKALPQWAIDTEHEIGTPGVRALAQALALDGAGGDRAAVDGDDAFALTTELAAAFVNIAGPDGADLLVDAVTAADHPTKRLPSPYTPGDWVDAAATWTGWAAESADDAWMDAGMFARETMGENVGGATDEDLLSTIVGLFGEADADLLRTGLTALGLRGWPAWDMHAPTPIGSQHR